MPDYLDTILFNIPINNNKADMSPWTIRHAVEGVQIFGGIGSGKTSGSGRFIALKYLSAGFGGLVLTVKPDEKELWQEYGRLTGREKDLIIVEPGGDHVFNFLQYESEQAEGGNAITDNLVQLLKTVMKASEEKSSGKSDDAFWESALDMLVFSVIDLCKIAFGEVGIQKMYDLVQSLPKEGKGIEYDSVLYQACMAAKENVDKQIISWQNRQSVETLIQALAYPDDDSLLRAEIPDYRMLKFINQFIGETYGNLTDKTRSIIDFSFSGFLFRLLREPIYTLFCGGRSTFKPEDCLTGKIILLNLPVKIYHKVGRDMQIMFKYIWQRAMEKRPVIQDSKAVFLWADEAQNFLHEHDTDYQATARSSRIATVYISQNLPNYLANMGTNKFQYKVQSFLGTLATKIFHANADIQTNQYSSDLIGDGYFEETSNSTTISEQFSGTKSRSLKIDKVVRPEEFALLKTGGTKSNGIVEGYIHLQGDSLNGKLNHTIINFNQNYIPHQKTQPA